jgi:formylglycine-generating enzyme required for sulfatase activity
MVTAREALEFARWMGGRLPNSKQWAKAAGAELEDAGAGPYIEPWDPTSKTEIAVNRIEGPLPVGTAPKDISSSGVRDMAGNGYEWTRTLVAPASGYVPREFPDVQGDDMVLLRGQSYTHDEPLKYEILKDTSYDQMWMAEEPKFDIGFRVVIDALP